MEAAKKQFIVLLTLLLFVSGWLGAWILNMIDRYFSWYPAIPIFFFVFGILFIQTYSKIYAANKAKLPMLYMAERGTKLILGALFIMIYKWVVDAGVMSFVVTFLAYYMVYLIFESVFFIRFERKMKTLNQGK